MTPTKAKAGAKKLGRFSVEFEIVNRADVNLAQRGFLPPEKLREVNANAVAVYETDLDVPSRIEALRANGYASVRTFRDDPARAVVVFMRRK